MRRLLAPALVVLVATAIPLPPASADTVVGNDRATFDDAYPLLTKESFESSAVAAGANVGCDGPLSSTTANACFPARGLRPGVRFLADPGDTTTDFAVFGPGYSDVPSTSLLVENFDATLVMDFTVPVDTVGFDLSAFGGSGACDVSVRYVDRSAPTEVAAPCPVELETPRFLTIKADRLVDSVRVRDDLANGAVAVDNLRFGLRAPNAFTVTGVRQQAAAGTATLSVRVPAIGATTVSGPVVVRASVDSARPRTVAVPVAARGAALRTLRQRGRVTVSTTVTFRPNGGTARSRVVRVTLLLRR